MPIKAWTVGVPVEAEARAAARAHRARCRSSTSGVAVMPDVHLGMGATVGSVIPTQRRDHPGGGRRGHRLRHDGGADDACARRDLPDDLRGAAHARSSARCRTAAPTTAGRNDRGAWHDAARRRPPTAWARAAARLRAHHRQAPASSTAARTSQHLGTLGTGNHFIEVCLDEADRVWFMLHSGSRGVGNRIGSYFIELAKEDMRRWFINLPDQDLAYLPEGTRALRRLRRGGAAGRRTSRATNRELMMAAVLDARARRRAAAAVRGRRSRR